LKLLSEHDHVETLRLLALERADLLDTPAEPLFDALTRAAAAIAGTPIALVSLVDGDRQWFKSNVGLAGVTQTPRSVAFCNYAIHGTDLMEVPDAGADERFRENPLVAGEPGIRFYCGMPIVLAGEHAVGTLCVIDRAPRALTDPQREALRELGRAVAALIEWRSDARRAETRARLVDLAPAEALLFDAVTLDFIEGNATARGRLARLGIEPTEASLSDVLPVDASPLLAQQIEDVLLARVPRATCEVELPDAVRPRAAIVTIAVRETSRLAVVIEDAEPLRRMRHRISEQESLFREVCEHVPAFVWMADAGGHIDYINRRWMAFTGRDAEAEIGLGWLVRVHADDTAPFIEAFRSARESGQPFAIVCRVLRHDGEYRRVLNRGVPRIGEDGELYGFVGLAVDITEEDGLRADLRQDAASLRNRFDEVMTFKARLERDLAARNHELEDALAASASFAAALSHDVRAPLRSINAQASMILEDAGEALPDSARRRLRRMADSATGLADLLEALLKLSRLTGGPLQRVTVPLDRLARDAWEEVGGEPARLALEPLPSVSVDPALMKRVFVNLFANALKFGAGVPELCVRVCVTETERGAAILVSDNGIGFDASGASGLFQPFRRFHDAAQYPGTGVGLAFVERIVRRHGGRVWADSRVGAGATFYFTLGEREQALAV
jgi:PAS domain S-box-containing protein